MSEDVRTDCIGVGLLGCGTVGTGVLRLLASKANVDVRAVGVRDKSKSRDPAIDTKLFTEDLESIVSRDDVSIVVEVMGGLEPARNLIVLALRSGKHVVTANKALLAKHGAELFALAAEMGVLLMYEAAVAGGIPVIRALRESLTGDRVQSVHGIINGTSNYVLTQMCQHSKGFDETVKDAQDLGYAEADPAADVDGDDAAQKLQLLMYLAFGLGLEHSIQEQQSLRPLKPLDFYHANAFGYEIKPLAVARRTEKGVVAWVGPALVPKTHVLANINGVFNACFFHSDGLGPLLLSGRGAGMMPTAVSVVGDLIECLGIKRSLSQPSESRLDDSTMTLSAGDEVEVQFYLRFSVTDEPGVLGRLASTLGKHGVSIQRLVQDEHHHKSHAEIVVLSHATGRAALKSALSEIDQANFVSAPTLWMPLEDPDS